MAHQDTNLSNPSNARTGRLGKAIAAGTVVASSAIAGVQATVPVPVDHAAVSLASTVRTLRGVIPWPIDATLSGAVCGPRKCVRSRMPKVDAKASSGSRNWSAISWWKSIAKY